VVRRAGPADTVEDKATDGAVVAGHRAFALQDTWISTCGWLSLAVEYVFDFFVGTVVLASITTSYTPPIVSIPSESGVTSSNSTSFTVPLSTPP
jgi:hypothetical protein